MHFTPNPKYPRYKDFKINVPLELNWQSMYYNCKMDSKLDLIEATNHKCMYSFMDIWYFLFQTHFKKSIQDDYVGR